MLGGFRQTGSGYRGGGWREVFNDFRGRSADAAAFGTEQAKQADGGTAKMDRNVLVSGHTDRGENQSNAQHDERVRPNYLPWANLEIHLRAAVTRDGHDYQSAPD